LEAERLARPLLAKALTVSISRPSGARVNAAYPPALSPSAPATAPWK